ncbi:SsrA-binding protein SmpB [Staphylococcus massiliensis]|uniref:SsrA-binding protein n=1 Tax=Staphylococcus massiliensis S46 TaxID=1229783 RepID=K9B0Z1_9STAP|nr:SsrA-binding protein SmpB [Staphylococcus massiliensis]EKU48477.1 SsrA-binding protein [Staphylococcus massiliensis S46]MCG3400400.1 SsrA-binding protein SmpB [Staphylococcus massiliensis]MCG3401753.1 SsrA-binding protein SmpB [Staphylococcus massiliensis]MCG3412625.1 SsrA-binding protein SmpB [Staphylococcus massiliensis]PNZ98611.1 SsrA-binding protein SmpB [Staphylococcus massiliensis CCUG 55927]
MPKKKNTKGTLAVNRKARHDYNIESTIEAGIRLQGTEIKSIRRGSANLKDAFAQVKHGEIHLHNMHIAPYEEGNRYNHDPRRHRKLLLHKREILKLGEQTREIGYSIIPLKLYLKHGVCKVLLGVARGKKKYDKRQALKEKAVKRDMDRAMKDRY